MERSREQITLCGPLPSKSSLVDTEHLPKVRNTVTPVTSLILQGQTRIVSAELRLGSDPWLKEVLEKRQQLLVKTYNECRYHCVVARTFSANDQAFSYLGLPPMF